MPPPPIGQICLELGLLSPEGVRAALAAQTAGGRPRFGEAAISLGLLDDEALARALANQNRLNLLPAARLARLAVAPEVLARLPAALMRERLIVPALWDARHQVLSVITTDPTDIVALRAARASSRASRLRVYVAGQTALRKLLHRYLPPERQQPVHDEVAGLTTPPPGGLTILMERDATLAALLKRLETIEGTGAEVVSDPSLVTPLFEANGAGRLFFRATQGPLLEPHLSGWRSEWPTLHLCPVDGWARRHAVPYAEVRDFTFAALEAALLAADDPTNAAASRRFVRFVRALAVELGLSPEDREAVEMVALLGGVAQDDREPRGNPWGLRATVPPPWGLTRLLTGLRRRASGAELVGAEMGVEILYTARTVVRAGVPDGSHPVEFLGNDAVRHHGAVLRAMTRVLQREGLRRQIAAGAGRGSSVLLAVADPVERVALEGRLVSAGFETLATADAAGALALARARPPAVALVDERLAPRDGLALIADLSRDRSTREVPAVLLTESDRPRAITRAFELGAADVVERPLDLDDAMLRLRKVLDRGAAEDHSLTGRLEELGLHALVDTLVQGAATGRVLVSAPSAHGEIHVREGHVERCWISDHPDSTPVDMPLSLVEPVEGGGFEIRFGPASIAPRPSVVRRSTG